MFSSFGNTRRTTAKYSSTRSMAVSQTHFRIKRRRRWITLPPGKLMSSPQESLSPRRPSPPQTESEAKGFRGVRVNRYIRNTHKGKVIWDFSGSQKIDSMCCFFLFGHIMNFVVQHYVSMKKWCFEERFSETVHHEQHSGVSYFLLSECIHLLNYRALL